MTSRGTMLPFWLVLLAALCLVPAWHAGPAQAKPGDTGFTVAGTTLSADIYLDGDKVGTTPLPGVVPCPAGEHTIRVARPGYAPYIDVFKVREGKVAKIEVELVAVSGVLRLTANVAEARVFVDGQFLGEPPIDADLKVGPHTVKVSRYGYRETSFSVSAVAGEIIEKAVKLEELPPELNPYKPPPPPPPKWYERWWVWAAGAGGVAVLAVAIVVPTVLATRTPCEKAGADVCVPVPAPAAHSLMVSVPLP